MTEPKKLHLKHPPAQNTPTHGPAAMSGGRRAFIPPEKRHGPAAVAAAAAAPRRRRGPGKGVVLAIFGAVVLLAVGFALLNYMKEKRIEARRELFALKGERDKAEEIYAQFHPLVERVSVMQAEAEGAATRAQEAVQFITGQPLAAFTGPKTTAVPRATPGPAAAPTPEPPPPPAPEPREAREVIDGREQPEGVESLADLERRRQMEQQQRQGVSRPPPGAPPAPPEAALPPSPPTAEAVPPAPEAAPEKPAPGGPDVVRLTVEIGRLTDDIREKHTQVAAIREEAESVGNATMRAPTSLDAAKSVAKLQELAASAEHTAGLAAASLDQVRSAAARVSELRGAEERARQMREEEARRRQAEEDHRNLVAKEKTRAGELHTGARALIERYEFAQARAEMETARAAMQTDEGRAAMQHVIDRFARLQEMKESLIRYLNAKPFRWGWGSGGAAKDVRGADADSVDVVGGRVLWQDVSLPQMVKFVDHYQIDTTERLSVRADLAIGLAILLDELGRRTEATEYARRAREAGEYGQQAAREMLPDY